MKKQDVGDPQHTNKVLQSIKSPATLESWKLFSSPFINAVMMLHAPGVPKFRRTFQLEITPVSILVRHSTYPSCTS